MTANHARPSPSEMAEKVRSLGAPLKRDPEGEFILDKYICLTMTLDLAKDVLTDDSAPDDAKVLAQAILGISQALELQRLRALDDLGPPM